MSTNAIYGLKDSSGMLRYIGKTQKPLSDRLKSHLAEAKRKGGSYRLNWLRSLEEPPVIFLLEQLNSYKELDAREIYWIALSRDYGCHLVNGTDGGEGGIPTIETRKKMSSSRRKWRHTDATRIKIGLIHRGKKMTEANRLALLAANLGKVPSEETRKKISIANAGRKRTPEAVEKSAAAHRGRKRSLETRRRMSLAKRKKI